ncbi:MAG: hypothetical protein L0J54_09400 [Halomonas sp.]|nr:hypothetical protein [Halomonas sp.]MDN6298220.1 hypothetical protein [Halomonas sp.]MDN6315566.1 hypothetical protein [Halomonas sp.]MDN6336716.1 hypothetical protein [Halomonas sp.]
MLAALNKLDYDARLAKTGYEELDQSTFIRNDKNDQALVSQSFDHLLGRAPGADELNAWTHQLESG